MGILAFDDWGGGGGAPKPYIRNCYSINCGSMFVFLADPSAISIRFMQRAALQAKLAQGFDHNQDSPQNTGLSRYAYSHWGILIAVLAPLAVLYLSPSLLSYCAASHSPIQTTNVLQLMRAQLQCNPNELVWILF